MKLRSNRLRALAIIYAALLMIVSPIFVQPFSYSTEILFFLLPDFGFVLLMIVAVWYINYYFFNRITLLFQREQDISSSGISNLSIIGIRDITKFVDSLFPTRQIDILVDLSDVNRLTSEMLNILLESSFRLSKVRLLIVGGSRVQVYEGQEDFEYIEDRIRQRFLTEVRDFGFSDNLDFRQLEASDFNTFLMNEKTIFVISRFSPFDKEMLLLEIKSNTQMAIGYQELFEKLWFQASKQES